MPTQVPWITGCRQEDRPSDEIILRIPGELPYVHLIGRCAREMLAANESLIDDESILYNLELAIQEIAVNIVTHAYAGSGGAILMTAYCDDTNQLHITLEDQGQAFDPTTLVEPTLGILQEHGYGLFLAQQLLDEVIYERCGNYNRWRLRKSLPIP